MSLFGNLINLNIQKLFLSGNIDKVYEKMYNVAEKLAIHEVKLYQDLLMQKMTDRKIKTGKDFDSIEYFNKVVNHRQERLQHHINEMKELLKLREQLIPEKNDKNNRKRS